MSQTAKQTVLFPLVLFIGFLISTAFTALFFFLKMLWTGNIVLCITLVLLEGLVLMTGAGARQILKKGNPPEYTKKYNETYSAVWIIYGSFAFFMLFFGFSFCFVKSYQMAQIMLFGCGTVGSLALVPVVIGFCKKLGFAVSLAGPLKVWHLAAFLLILIGAASIKGAAYNPAFFHTTYTGYVTRSTVTDINEGDIIRLTFSYQISGEDDYQMHLLARCSNKLLFGKFSHGVVYGSMEIREDGTYVLDVYDDEPDDGDPAVTLNTNEALFTYLSEGKFSGEVEAALD